MAKKRVTLTTKLKLLLISDMLELVIYTLLGLLAIIYQAPALQLSVFIGPNFLAVVLKCFSGWTTLVSKHANRYRWLLNVRMGTFVWAFVLAAAQIAVSQLLAEQFYDDLNGIC